MKGGYRESARIQNHVHKHEDLCISDLSKAKEEASCKSAIHLQCFPLTSKMLQDWNYLAGDCLELTLELSLNKWPPASRLPSLWEENRLPLLHLPLTAAFGGLR